MEILFYKCQKCGAVYRPRRGTWNFPCTYQKCGCTEYKTISKEWDCTDEEWEDFKDGRDKLEYLVNKIFNERKPQKNDYFGCIEMCELLKDKYQLDNNIFELVGLVKSCMFGNSMAHAEQYYPVQKTPLVMLSDGRRLDYQYYYYRTSLNDNYDAEYTREQTDAMDTNPKEEIDKLIRATIACKPSTYAQIAGDIDFSLDDMKLARKALKKEVDEELRKEQTISNRNKVVEEMTKPIKNIDSNYIESAECPNCHKKAVYRISDIKRGASIGLFGLFSKNIGKTMECRSCGYKW